MARSANKQYGMVAGRKIEKLPHEPLAHEITIRSMAQSRLSKGGKVAPLPTYEEALKILKEPNLNE